MADGVIPAQEILRAVLDYDPETGALTHKGRPAHMFSSPARAAAWNRRYAGKSAVSRIDAEGYVKVCLFGSRCRAHRVIWKLVNGSDPKFIDHINGDTSDNRLANLRDVEFAENCRNRKVFATNTSGVTGVSWRRRANRWIARIGTGKCLGSFERFEDAVKARRDAEKALGYTVREAAHG